MKTADDVHMWLDGLRARDKQKTNKDTNKDKNEYMNI